jgi:hypothetical protein
MGVMYVGLVFVTCKNVIGRKLIIMNKKIPWYKTWLCKVIGHKFTQPELAVFEIKNNPVNVAIHGYSPITCPRCKEVFDPSKEANCEKSNSN